MHYHHLWWRFFPKKKLTQIYISAAVRYFAVSLISLFVPLYLHQELGYTLNQTLWFFIIYSLALALFSPFSAKFAARFGCKHSILVSVPLYLLFILGLYLLPEGKISLYGMYLIGAVLGASLSFYWMGMHAIFRKVSDCKHRGEEFGKRESISIVATMLGPIMGGLLIKYSGFKIVFVLAALLLFASAFFLFLSKEQHTRYHFSFRSLFYCKDWKNYLFFISRGARAIAAGVVWPLFVFIIIKDYLSLGLIESIPAGICALLIWLIGKYSDHVSKQKILRWVAGFEALSWIGRVFVNSMTQVFGITIFGAVTYGIYESPAGAMEYDKACGNHPSFFISREIFLCFGRVLLLSIVLITNSLSGGLIFNGIATLAAYLF
ncbi:MAG: MFS transporter [Candidatus Woesearchaeota archaeon]